MCCMCCAGDNVKVVPSVSMATSSTGSGTQTLMDVFKKAGDTWDCPECMVTNKVSMTTCPCCSTPQPGLKTAATTAADTGAFKVSWSQPIITTVNTLLHRICSLTSVCCIDKCQACSSGVLGVPHL